MKSLSKKSEKPLKRICTMPEVSIIVPVYNVEPYLEKCLDSIINQTFKNIEIICIDDCSTDNSLKILENYALKDARIKVIKNKKNSGAAISRNYGLDLANAEYIYFMDSDDWIDKGYIKELLLNIKKSGCDIAFNSTILYAYENKTAQFFTNQIKNIPKNGKIITDKNNIMSLPCMAWCRLYKKSFLNKNNIKWLDIPVANDLVFHYISEIYTDKIWVYSGLPYYYRQRPNGLSRQDALLREPKAIEKIFKFYQNQNLLNKINFKLFTMHPSFVLQNEAQYSAYKKYFKEIHNIYKNTINKYNNFDRYIFNAIVNTKNFEDFKNKYASCIFVSFLRQNTKGTTPNA